MIWPIECAPGAQAAIVTPVIEMEDAGQQKGQGGAADGPAEPVWRIGAFDHAVERVQPSEQKYVDLLILQLG